MQQQQQQQQQIISRFEVLEQPLESLYGEALLNDMQRPSCALPAHLVQPLLLTLLQLCAELMPNLTLMHRGVDAMNAALKSCMWLCENMKMVAAYAQVTAKRSEDGTCASVLEPQHNTAQSPPSAAAAAKAEMEAAYREARRAVAQPLLHVLGPAVLKEMRRVEQGLNSGSVSSRIAQLPGMTVEQSAVDQADQLMGAFGRVVLRVVIEGELRRCCQLTACPHHVTLFASGPRNFFWKQHSLNVRFIEPGALLT
jgi:hypothetical protein